MKASEIRLKFLKYFEKNGHTLVESSSLVPQNDPTLLFTNAGMVQFKDVFLGKDKRPYSRATSSQKCVRAGGKHNDLENVGFTARHHTFFEMLGNFSFGDYFKKDAIRFAWEFVTQELKLPKDKLYVTVFEKDDEAAEIWHKQEGVPKDRIYRFGEKDNFWAMGDTGPCGPCSEIFVDRGEKYSCGKPTCAMGCDCDRYMEFWNLVFMQFERDSSGKLTPLPKPSVDTGAGLERIASILQGVDTNYDTDLFQEIIQRTVKLLEQNVGLTAKAPTAVATYEGDAKVSYRVIADHSRATAFLIGDGVLPSNEGRGYVLRRIMRRAIRHGKKLGFTGPFLHKTAGFVIDQMKDAYPDLIEKRAFIERAVIAEEEQFFKTVERGLALLDEEVDKLTKGGALGTIAKPGTETKASGHSIQLPGDVAFKLYDTYGFPLDLTRVICEEKGISIDEVGFEKCMDRQRAMSREHWKGSGDEAVSAIYMQIAAELKSKERLPKFVGYEQTQAQGECVAILVREASAGAGKGDSASPAGGALRKVDAFTAPSLAQTADSAEKAALVEAVFAVTPFYGESGGQVGDAGRISGEGFEGEVIDVQRPIPELIVAHIRPKKGALVVGKRYLQETDRELRALTARNHTATHLLHWALRDVLGKHVKQAGSLVTPELLRFDFAHFQPLTETELTRIEDMINEKIWSAFAVGKKEMKKDEAIAAGAIAFFGEKYGDLVRVVRVGDFSTELCGGTHVDNSGEIHLFKIGNESGIAAGVRRIIAYTSKGAFDYLRARDGEVKLIRDRLKASSSDEIIGKLDRMTADERALRKQVEQLQAKSAAGEVDEILMQGVSVKETHILSSICAPDALGVKRLRDISDKIKQKAPNSVTVLGIKDPADDSKVSLLVAVGPQAPKTLNANNILKELLPFIDGRGGGKPDLAQAGGTKAAGLKDAIERSRELIGSQLKG